MTRVNQRRSHESGFVSIFTVMFFMILVTVLTLGFLRIMLDERRQSIDNDLTATALNAAEAGIEDGKRLLLYCTEQINSGGPDEAMCAAALGGTECPGVFGNSSMANALGIDSDAVEDDGSIRVSNDAGTEQHYTCLLVNSITDDYESSLEANQSDLIPLRRVSNAPINRIELSWHMTTASAQGTPVAYPANKDTLPSISEWASNQYPAYMRIQLIQHPNNTIDLQALDDNSRSAFLVPVDSGAATIAPTVIGLNDSIDQRTGAKTKAQPVEVRCISPGGVPAQLYACQASMQLNGAINGNETAYLRVTPLYGATDFKVNMYTGSNLIRFDGAQPIIDATGRSNDVFRRVQARVRLDTQAFYPQFALESGKDICKDFLVTADTGSYVNFCSGP